MSTWRPTYKRRDPYPLIRPVSWPCTHDPARPVLLQVEGEGVDQGGKKKKALKVKNLVVRMPEDLLASLDAHCEALGQTVSKWVREAISHQLQEEQNHFIEEAEDRDARERYETQKREEEGGHD